MPPPGGAPAGHYQPYSPRLVWWCVILTTAAAILVRLSFPYAWNEATTAGSVFYQGDTRAFLAYAAHLVAGQPFDNGVPFHPPGWPFVLSCFFRLIGSAPLSGSPPDPAVLKLFAACISGLSVGLTALLAQRLAGQGAMLAVALLGTFHFGHIVQGTTPNSEPLYGLLVAAILLLATAWIHDSRAQQSPGARRGQEHALNGGLARSMVVSVALGGLCAFTSLVRAEFVLGAILLAGVRWRYGPFWRRRNLEVAAYGVGFVLALTPTTIWHWQSLSAFNATHADRLPGPLPRFAPVTSYGAFNFAMANHELAEGGPNHDHPLLAPSSAEEEATLDQGQLDLASPAAYHVYVHGYAIGLRWMVEHPVAALSLMRRKAALTSGVFAHGYLLDNWPIGVDGIRRRVDELDPSRRWMWPLHLALVLLGAWVLWPDRPSRWLLGVPLATLAASSLLFFGYVRLGVAYLPVFWVMQGAAIGWLTERILWPEAWRRRRAGLVLTVGGVLLVLQMVSAGAQRRVLVDGPRGPDGTVIEDEELRIISPSR